MPNPFEKHYHQSNNEKNSYKQAGFLFYNSKTFLKKGMSKNKLFIDTLKEDVSLLDMSISH